MEHVIEIKSGKSLPKRVNGFKTTVDLPAPDAPVDVSVTFLTDALGENTSKWIRRALERDAVSSVNGFLKGKALTPGKKYTREEKAKLPQRAEKVSEAELVAFGKGWKPTIRTPKGAGAKIQAAEAKARRSEEQKDAAVEMMLETLRELATRGKDGKAAADAKLSKMIDAGHIPAGTTL